MITALAIAGLYYRDHQGEGAITTFDECVAARYPVMESYPRQCRTADGRVFVESVEVQPEPVLPDGEYLGFIREVGSTSIAFDDAEWLTGTEGENAAIVAGLCSEETRNECLPNGFFIRNTSTSTQNMEYTSDVRVYLSTWHMEETGNVEKQETTVAGLTQLINDQTTHWHNLPFTVSIVRGNILTIEEVYVP